MFCKDTNHKSLSNWIANIKSSFLEGFVELYDIINTDAKSSNTVQFLFSGSDPFCDSAANTHQGIYLSLCSRKTVYQTKLELFVMNKTIKDFNSKWFMLMEELEFTNKFSFVFCEGHFLLLYKANQQQIVIFLKLNSSLALILFKHCHVTKNATDTIKLGCLQHLLHFGVISCTFEHSALIKLTSKISSTLLAITFHDNYFSSEQVDAISSLISVIIYKFWI